MSEIQELGLDAGKAYAWLKKETSKVVQGGPRAVAALGVLLSAVSSLLQDASQANVAAVIAQIKTVWIDVQALAADFGIKI